MKIIVLDKRDMFLADIQTQLLINMTDIELVGQSTQTTGVQNLIRNEKPDYLFIAENIVSEQNGWNYDNVTVVGYRSSKQGDNPFDKLQIASYGYVEHPEDLIDLISAGIPEIKTEAPVKPQKTAEPQEQKIEKEAPVAQPKQPEPVVAEPKIEQPAIEQKNEPVEAHTAPKSKDIYNITAAKNIEDEAQSLFEQDLVRPKKKTKIVTVYAAKGGVGKTTISTSLATYLSLVSEGRGYLKVCIIDCNIDFGDVISVIEYKSDGPNLTYWADEIKTRIARGEKPEDIVYSTAEIEARLQKSNTGLYALLAPMAHEDSMGIGTLQEKIIFGNIVENGGFDYIICDTGNNTRHFSMMALREADIVLMVQTQDTSTASCNRTFLNTMKKSNFDMSKIRNVFNIIMTNKSNYASVQDLEEIFPFPCVAQINNDDAIRVANNDRKSLIISNPNHAFTKEIQKIATHVMGRDAVVKKRPGLFARLKTAFRGE